MTFQSEEKAYEFYSSYARTKGFSIRRIHKKHRADGTLCSRYFECTNETKKGQATKRKSCPARVQFAICREGIWTIQNVLLDHDHVLVTPNKEVSSSNHISSIAWIYYVISDHVATTVQPTMTTEGVDGHDVADCVVETDLQKEGQDLLSTRHPPLKSTCGDDGDVVAVVESKDAAVGKEPEPVKATDEEVSQLNHISSSV